MNEHFFCSPEVVETWNFDFKFQVSRDSKVKKNVHSFFLGESMAHQLVSICYAFNLTIKDSEKLYLSNLPLSALYKVHIFWEGHKRPFQNIWPLTKLIDETFQSWNVEFDP